MSISGANLPDNGSTNDKKNTTQSISLSFLSPVYLASDLLHLLSFIPPAFSTRYRNPVCL